jgi:small-conductance mechanosensitive channel
VELSEDTVRAIVTAAVGLVVVLAVRWGLRLAFSSYERRLETRDPADAARRRTTYSFLGRVTVAIVAAIVVWQVLSIFPETEQIARALLASSAVLAIFAGLALNTPLSNLGSGVLVAFTQPVRLGDRVTIGGQTGFVEQINLIYTTLVTDDDRRIFIPNSQLTSTVVVNRTIKDPRRAVTATLPVRLGAPLDEAQAVALRAAESVDGVGDVRVSVSEVTEKLVWLTVTAFAPLTADVEARASAIRARGLSELGEAGLLPL